MKTLTVMLDPSEYDQVGFYFAAAVFFPLDDYTALSSYPVTSVWSVVSDLQRLLLVTNLDQKES